MTKKTYLSDKSYWHGYIPFYENFFLGKNFKNIAEFGVYKGNSIRWLLDRFPSAQIYGADILPLQTDWPIDPRFHFVQLDQANQSQVQGFLKLQKFDLIIEDGSHLAQHQINCLIEGLEQLGSGGIYILEDIQTSRIDHLWWQPPKVHWWKFGEKRRARNLLKAQQFDKGNAMHLLLAIDHFNRIEREINEDIAQKISETSLFSKTQILRLASQIQSINLFQRNHLPDMCHGCGSANFDFNKLKCICGEDLFSDADSMSFLIIKN